MKIDKSLNALLMFIAILMMLTTAYYVNKIAMRDNVSSEYSKTLSLNGLRLSDEIYAYSNIYYENRTSYGYNYEYDNGDKYLVRTYGW